MHRVKIKPGDFFYVPSGTIHALMRRNACLETQQSSDTTYRVYDYDRKDDQGNLRDLHLEKAIDVTTVPHQGTVTQPTVEKKEHATMTTYVESEFFSVYKWDIGGETAFNTNDTYLLVSVIDGEGTLKHGGEVYPVKKGSNLILPVGFGGFSLDGTLQAIVSHR